METEERSLSLGFYIFFSQVAGETYAVMHEAVVLDSGVHCVRCQLRDLRILNSTKNKNPQDIQWKRNSLAGLYRTIRLKNWTRHERRREGLKEGVIPPTSELNLVSNSRIPDSVPLQSLRSTLYSTEFSWTPGAVANCGGIIIQLRRQP